jgi:hypothetical protein
LRIPFHLLHRWCNTCTNHITNDMIHFISSCDLVGSSIFTSLVFHRCLHPSVPSLAQASPPCGPSLQGLQLALHACNQSVKRSLVLILLQFTHMTQCHVSYAMSSFITCVSVATNPSHLLRHGLSCSHKCTYRLITCVSHISPRLSLNYQNQTRDLSGGEIKEGKII